MTSIFLFETHNYFKIFFQRISKNFGEKWRKREREILVGCEKNTKKIVLCENEGEYQKKAPDVFWYAHNPDFIFSRVISFCYHKSYFIFSSPE